MRALIGLAFVVAGGGASISAERLGERPFTALGLDSRQTIRLNLAALSEPREFIEGLWHGSIDTFDVNLSGKLDAAPEVINVSIPSLYSRRSVEATFGFDPADGHVASCPTELLMDDGIGCGAVFYWCVEAAGRCNVMVTSYERDPALGYQPFPGHTFVTWSLEGFEYPAP